MIQTTKDILFLILGISILVISFFLAIFLYYLVKLVKKLYNAGRFVEKISAKLNEITKTAEKKVKEITLLPLLSEAIRTAIEFLKERKKSKEEKKEE